MYNKNPQYTINRKKIYAAWASKMHYLTPNKGTIVVNIINPPFKERHTRFTMVPFKSLSNKKCEKYHYFTSLKSALFLYYKFKKSLLQRNRAIKMKILNFE